MKRKLFLLASSLAATFVMHANPGGDPTPPTAYVMPYEPRTPTTQGLINFLEFANVGNNGAPDIMIPLYEIQSRELALSLSLSYNASGIKVADEAGNVGLNWNLIAGGMITRTIRDKEDNTTYWDEVYENIANGFDPFYDVYDYQTALGLVGPTVDGIPDLYSYNLP